MDPILTAAVGVLLGALLGVAVWLLKDVRSTVKETASALTQFRIEVARGFVTREDCASRHKTMDAKLDELEREYGKAKADLVRVRTQLKLEEKD
jgi:hypothetical protein